MPHRSSGTFVLIRRLLVLVFATKRCRLPCRCSVQFFKARLKRSHQLFEFLDALTERLIFRFKLLNPKIARVSIHAIHLASLDPKVTR